LDPGRVYLSPGQGFLKQESEIGKDMLYSRTKYKKLAKTREDKAKAEAKAAFLEHREKQKAAKVKAPEDLGPAADPSLPPAGEAQLSDEQIVAKCDELKKELWKDLSKKEKALVKSLTA
jgi:uncharacterized protein with WD repeat